MSAPSCVVLSCVGTGLAMGQGVLNVGTDSKFQKLILNRNR
jgi:hypothetical protein